MVQIIDRAPTIGQTLAGLIGQGAEGAAQGFEQAQNFTLSRALDQFRDQEKGSRIDEILAGIDDERYGDQEKQIIKAMAMGDLPPSVGQKLIEQLTAPQGPQITPKDISAVNERIDKIGPQTIGKNVWDDASPAEKDKYRRIAEDYYRETGDQYGAVEFARQKMVQDYSDEEEDLKDEISKPGTQSDSAWKLGTQNSIIGRMNAIANGESIKDFNERLALPEDANIFEKTQYKIAQFIADSPFYYAGGQAGATAGAFTGGALGATTVIGIPFGAAAGTLVGGGAGTMALPAMIDSALTQYHEYLSNGGEGSFEGFVEAMGNTLKAGVDAGTEGAIFGIISRVMPLLKKNASMRKLFESTGKKGKVAETVVTSALESGAILSSRMASGQQVTQEDAGELFTTILGFNTFSRMTPRLQRKVAQTIEKTGIHPQDFIENVKLDMEAKGADPTNPRELQRSVTDVSKKYSKAKEVFKEAHKPEIGEQQLEAKRTEERELAERITKEPVEEILDDEPKLSKKAKEAREEMRTAEVKLNEALEKLDVLQGAKQKTPTIEQATKLVTKEVQEARTAFESAKNAFEEVAPKKRIPETPEQIAERIKNHNRDLIEIAKDPTSEKAKKIHEKFAKDQSYIDRLQAKVGEEPLPTAKTVDSYLRPLEAYHKAYENLLEEVNARRKSLEKETSPKAKKERQELDRLKNLLQQNMKINEAKRKLHNPKRFIREVARGRGKTYLKQALKDMGIRAKEFDRNFFKVREVLEGTEAKAGEVGTKKLKEIATTVENVVKDPSTKNVEKLASETGATKAEVREAKGKSAKAAEKAKEAIKEGETPNSFEKLIQEELKFFTEKNWPKLRKAALGGLVLGGIAEGLEKITGVTWPISGVAFLFPGARTLRFGAAFMTNQAKKVYKFQVEKYWKNQFQQASGTERARLRRKLKQKGWTDSQINKFRR